MQFSSHTFNEQKYLRLMFCEFFSAVEVENINSSKLAGKICFIQQENHKKLNSTMLQL